MASIRAARDRGQRDDRLRARGLRERRLTTVLLARSDASAWRAEEQAHSLRAKVDGADAERIKVTTDPGDLADCDLVVEAIVEELGPKVELLKAVGDARCRRRPRDHHLLPLARRARLARAATPSASSACTPSTRW